MAWRIVVQGRNVVVDEMAARQRTVIAEAERRGPRSVDRAQSRARAARESRHRRPAGTAPEAYQALVERTRAAHDRAERDLAEASAAFRQEQSRTHADVREVLAALPKQTALVSYVRYVPEQLPGSPRLAPKTGGSAKNGATAGASEDYRETGAAGGVCGVHRRPGGAAARGGVGIG